MSEREGTTGQRSSRRAMAHMLLIGIVLGALHYALTRVIGAKIPFNIFLPWLLCSSIVAMMAGAWVHHRRREQGRAVHAGRFLWGFVVMVLAVAINLKVPTLFWAEMLLGGIDVPVLEPTWLELHMVAEALFFLTIPVVYFGLGLVFASAYEVTTRPHLAYGGHLIAFAVGGAAAYLSLAGIGMMWLFVGIGVGIAPLLLPARHSAAAFVTVLIAATLGSHASPDKFFMWSVDDYEPMTETVWSPYYKLDFASFGDQCAATISNNYLLYYTCDDALKDHLQRRELFKVIAPDRDDFLVVGSSTGVALQTIRQANPDFKSAIGLEVDPVTVDMAVDALRDYNGDIFHDPRVRVFRAEGRAFMEQTPQKFDLVYLDGVDNRQFIFPMSSLSVETYLFTKEGISRALDMLTDDGILLMDVGGTAIDQAIPFVATLEGEAFYDMYWYVVADYPMVGLPLFFIFASRDPEQVKRLRPQLHRIGSIEAVDRPCFEQGCIGDGYVPATDDRPFIYQYSTMVRAAGWIPILIMLFVIRWLMGRIRRSAPEDPALKVYPFFILLGGLYGAAQSVLVLQGSRKLMDPALASTMLVAAFLMGNALANFIHARKAPPFGLKMSGMVVGLLAWTFFTILEGSGVIFAIPMALVGGFAVGWLWPRAISWLPANRRAMALAMDGAGVLIGITATQWIFAAYGLTALKWVTVATCAALCGLYVRHGRAVEGEPAVTP